MRQPTLLNRKRPEFRICPICQVEFCVRHRDQRWCSTDCAQRAKRLASDDGDSRLVRRASRMSAPPSDLPSRIGPVEFGNLGNWVTARCPQEYNRLMRRAGGLWDPVSKRWLIHQRRIGLVIRELERTTDSAV